MQEQINLFNDHNVQMDRIKEDMDKILSKKNGGSNDEM